MGEAEDLYLASISDDCETVLGPGITLIGVEREDREEAVRLVARYRLNERVWESSASGDTVVEAHAVLRARLLFDRVRLGFTAWVERP